MTRVFESVSELLTFCKTYDKEHPDTMYVDIVTYFDEYESCFVFSGLFDFANIFTKVYKLQPSYSISISQTMVKLHDTERILHRTVFPISRTMIQNEI